MSWIKTNIFFVKKYLLTMNTNSYILIPLFFKKASRVSSPFGGPAVHRPAAAVRRRPPSWLSCGLSRCPSRARHGGRRLVAPFVGSSGVWDFFFCSGVWDFVIFLWKKMGCWVACHFWTFQRSNNWLFRFWLKATTLSWLGGSRVFRVLLCVGRVLKG